jgi:hypothetical protein
MSVGAVIAVEPSLGVDLEASATLSRLIEAAWSGGAHPILVAGSSSAAKRSPLAHYLEGTDGGDAIRLSKEIVGGTTALIHLPLSHAGIDPETVTTLIAAHGRTPHATLRAAYHGVEGPISLVPIAPQTGIAREETISIECGDEGAVRPSTGADRLGFDAPPVDSSSIDPWERRGVEDR